MPSSPPTSTRPLAVTADEKLLDDLVRLAAACGAELDVAHDIPEMRRRWSAAPLVIVGGDLAPKVWRNVAAPRPDVIVVAHDLENQPQDIWEAAVMLGARHVLDVHAGESTLVNLLADAVEGSVGEAVVIGVVGGRGGAGASTLASGLAVTAALDGMECFLLDADPLGGGLDLVVGGEDSEGMRWPQLAGAEGRMSSSALQSALPSTVERLSVLSWDHGDLFSVPPSAMRTVLSAARRGRDLVVVDLPRHVDDTTKEALSQCRSVLLVVPAEVRAVASGARIADLVSRYAYDVRVVVRGPGPSGLDGGIIAEALGLPLIGELTSEPRLDLMLERGEPPAGNRRGPLATLCRQLLVELEVRPRNGRVTAA
ncbi:MAG TPA: septum site-determining protein Ssd [Actinopolymorphaceae bacterium]|jgi:secretion/DNA translocation related CpaE-like protein